MRKFIVFAALYSGIAFGQMSQLGDKAVMEMGQIPYKAESPVLIGGDPVTAAEYPGVFYTSQGNSRCTGTLIGAQVVASAAHCMSNGGGISLSYKGKNYSGTCTHAPQYRGNSTADWALCKLSEPIPDAIAEAINTEKERPKVGDYIRLMGFGCVQQGGGGGNDGTLRSNMAKVTSLPSGTNYDTITKDRAALCYGDSGGPSFVYDAAGKRYQLAINSRGDIRTTSYLSTISAPPAVAFYSNWSADNGVKICGLHPDATGCRSEGPPPPRLPEQCEQMKGIKTDTLLACLSAATPPTKAECDGAVFLAAECNWARFPD
jgi:hypothetical protein